jgi:DNA-binding NtrC family response regulator
MKQSLLEEFERDYLVRCLEAAEMNVSLASRYSGLSRKHIRTLMAKYGIVVRRELSAQTELDDDELCAVPAT